MSTALIYIPLWLSEIDYFTCGLLARHLFYTGSCIQFLHSIYPIYSTHGRVAWLLRNIYTNYDDAFTSPDLWLSVNSLPGYQACSSLALLADTAYLYTANDVRYQVGVEPTYPTLG